MKQPQQSTSKELTPIWAALSDPTRREILDLLRERPRTTGELTQRFPSSRYAVMKHLTALEDRLVSLGSAVDIAGRRIEDIGPETVERIIETYPRLGFKKAVIDLLFSYVKKNPQGFHLHGWPTWRVRTLNLYVQLSGRSCGMVLSQSKSKPILCISCSPRIYGFSQ